MITIRDAARRFGGEGRKVYVYDEPFRIRQACRLQPWDKIHQYLWLRVIPPVQLLGADGNPQVPPPQVAPQQALNINMPAHKLQTCNFFNRNSCYFGYNCKFAHLCAICKSTNQVATKYILKPTTKPRITAAARKAIKNCKYVSGVSNKNTMLPITFDCTRLDELFANAFCNSDIMISPGTKNAVYGTSS